MTDMDWENVVAVVVVVVVVSDVVVDMKGEGEDFDDDVVVVEPWARVEGVGFDVEAGETFPGTPDLRDNVGEGRVGRKGNVAVAVVAVDGRRADNPWRRIES